MQPFAGTAREPIISRQQSKETAVVLLVFLGVLYGKMLVKRMHSVTNWYVPVHT